MSQNEQGGRVNGGRVIARLEAGGHEGRLRGLTIRIIQMVGFVGC